MLASAQLTVNDHFVFAKQIDGKKSFFLSKKKDPNHEDLVTPTQEDIAEITSADLTYTPYCNDCQLEVVINNV